jgi:predicted permease
MTVDSNRGATIVALVISMVALVLTVWMAVSAQGSDDLYADEITVPDASVASPPASDARGQVAAPRRAPRTAVAQAGPGAPPASSPQSQR